MTQFNGYHIQQFNQKCKSLVGDGKVVYSFKELRDLQAEILDLLVALRAAEQSISNYKQKEEESNSLTIELNGGSF